MSLQLILGSSGAGKTEYLYRRLIEQSIGRPDRQSIVIVPEQFTMETQKQIVQMHPRKGTFDIDIVSFQRLAYRVFEELAVEQLLILDDMGKSMILRKVMNEQRNKLNLFKRHFNQTGFINQMKSMLSELYQYGISADEISTRLPETESSLLRAKMNNIAIVFEAFQQYIASRYITTEEILDVLCKVLPDSALIKNSVITLDGYTGFTPVQYRVIELLLRYAQKVSITIAIDPQEIHSTNRQIQHLFYMSHQMIQRLNEIAIRNHIEKEQDIIMEAEVLPRFRKSLPLQFLERNLFRYHGRIYEESPPPNSRRREEESPPPNSRRREEESPVPNRWREEAGRQHDIRIFRSVNPLSEVAFILNQIQEMVQMQQLRYRDIAIITGDLGTYGRELDFQLRQQQIPFFMDDKKSILNNPMVEWIRAMLETIQSDFSYESVFRYLKSGLAIPGEQQNLLYQMENYVLAMGIRGYSKWQAEWSKVPRRQPHLNINQLNGVRAEWIKPLEMIRQAFSEEVSIAAVTDAVLECLEFCRIEEKMQDYQQYFHQIGDYAREKEYSQIYGLVLELFQRLKELLGEELVSRKEYREILDAGFEELAVGVIPATQDQILIGDITRTRLNKIKVLFLVGVNEGIIPAQKGNTSLLTDMEREILKSYQVELAPTEKEDGFIQRFYLYLLMTKPSEKLILSYSSLTAEGKAQRPSVLIAAVRKMFPNLGVETEQSGRKVISVSQSKKILLDSLRTRQIVEEPSLLELYRWFGHSERYRERARNWVDAAFFSYEDKGIGRQAAIALYGKVLRGSVTRLEQYAGCAYAHFLKYGLELQEKREHQFEAVDWGNLFHESIYYYFKQLEEQQQEWQYLSEQEQQELVSISVKQAAGEYENNVMYHSARMKYLEKKIERMTRRTIWALTQQLKKGDFTPAGLELQFSAGDGLEAMQIPLSEAAAIHLQGRIDRLDVCVDQDQLLVKIIDYKTGSKKFDLSDLYHGLQIQLFVYLDAVIELEAKRSPGKKVVPAGVFYYQVKDPLVERSDIKGGADLDDLLLAQLKMSGLVNSDLDVIRHLDHEIEKKSEVIPVTLKNGVIQERYSSVASQLHFEQLSRHVYHLMKVFGTEILAGKTAINPYKLGDKTACDYCLYHSVCGFEAKGNRQGYRKLKELKPEEVWEAINESPPPSDRRIEKEKE